MPRSVAILGLGLIGGSLLHRLSQLPGVTPVGYDPDPATRRAAADAGFAVFDSARTAVATADIVLAAAPLPALPELLAEVGAAVRPGCLVTDVTSVKGPIAQWVRGPVRFVGGHPMAGTERSGFAAAELDLFNGAAWVLCLEPDTDLAGWLELAALVVAIGARVVPATAAEHDAAVARISHLPHVLAATLAIAADSPLALALAAGSFRDGTRVAARSPDLPVAMCRGNAAALTTALDTAIETLQSVRAALADQTQLGTEALPARQSNVVPELFGAAYRIRHGWPATGTESVQLDRTSADLPEQLRELGSSGGWLDGLDAATLHGQRPAQS